MPTQTTFMSLNMPIVLGDTNAWGGYLNGDLVLIDALAVYNTIIVNASGPLIVGNGPTLVKATGGTSGITTTLPDATVAINKGRVFFIVKVDSGAGAVTVNGNGGQTISGAASVVLTSQWQSVAVQADGANWISLNASSAAITSVFGRTGVVTAQTGDYTFAKISGTITVSQLAGTTFGASGGSHSIGTVPDPGSSAGTTRYLREDATFVVPPGLATTISAVSHEWLTSYTASSGAFTQSQPTLADIAGGTAPAGTFSYGSATHTTPSIVGVTASKPGTCAVGEMYFATDATAGQNWYYCTATNTWTQQLNSGSGGFTPGTQNITPVNYATDTGSATAYAVAPSPAATSYVAGLTVTFVALHTNTGSATLNVSSLGAKNITKLGVNSLNPGDILVNGLYFATYDGTEFQLLNPTVGATPAVVGRSVSGTTDTITPIVGTDLGTEITYTSSSAVAVSVAAPTFAGAFFTVNIAGLGVVTLTPVSGNIGLGGVSGGASIALTGPLSCYVNSPDGTNYNANCHPNVKNAQTVTLTIASGSQALGTGAISSGACASPVSVGATGVLTTDTILANFNGDPTAVTGYIPSTSGMLTIIAYPSAGTVNFKVCNNTASSITPGAITLNYRVVR